MTVGVSHIETRHVTFSSSRRVQETGFIPPIPGLPSNSLPLPSLTMARGSSGSFKRGGRGGSRFGYRGNNSFRGGRGRGRGRGNVLASDAAPQRDEEGNQLAERFEQVKTNDEVDEKLGFVRIQEGPPREGWLINMHPVRALRAGDIYAASDCSVDLDERP